MALLVVALAFAGTVLPVVQARAGTLPGFRETAISRLNNPTAMSFLPGGRVLVAEKGGTVQLFDSLDDPTPDPRRGPSDPGPQPLGPRAAGAHRRPRLRATRAKDTSHLVGRIRTRALVR